MGMWFFLFTEILFFGGMFLLYAAYRFKYADAFHAAATEESLLLGTVNTAILLTSSLAMALAIWAIRAGRTILSILLQAATVLMGIAFLVIKYIEWSAKIITGIYPDSPALLALGPGQNAVFRFVLYDDRPAWSPRSRGLHRDLLDDLFYETWGDPGDTCRTA